MRYVNNDEYIPILKEMIPIRPFSVSLYGGCAGSDQKSNRFRSEPTYSYN